MKRLLGPLLVVLAACGDSSTGPSAPLALPQGQYVLRIFAPISLCAAAPGSTAGTPVTSAFALVALARSGAEWTARASGEAGDLDMRFRETQATRGGAIIEGSFRGTLANMAAAGGIAGSDTRASFGADGSAALSGVALVGPFSTSLINGDVRGNILFSDSLGRACISNGASWALQFVQ